MATRDDVRRLLDGELDEAEARALLEALTPAERREAEALARLGAAAAGLHRPAPSPDFAARTMARVRVRPPPRRSLWTWLRSPRLTPLGAFAGAAAAALLAVGVTAVVGPDGAQPPPAAEVVLARLDLRAPEATRVEVAGDFNGWRPEATPLRRGEGGVWSVQVPLPPGKRYEYSFVVDGAWVADPSAAATRDDGFGGANAVLEL
jgi:hypothetical protein